MTKRRIIRGEIEFITLCKRGANRLPVIYKEDGHFDYDMLVKTSDNFMEKGELLAVVYAPELRDMQGDIASAAVIKDMMYSAAKRGESVDIRHDGKALSKDQVYVAERFIVQKGDERFTDFKDYDGNNVDVTGAWATVLKIEDQKLRDHYKAGDWNGVSMGGRADLELEKDDDTLVERVVNTFAKALGITNKEDDDMNADEYKKLMEANNGVLAEAIGKSVGEAIAKGSDVDPDDKGKGGDDKTPKAPVFKGDASKPGDVAKHADALVTYELQKDVDWTDPKSISEYQEKVAEIAKAKAEAGDEGKSEDVKKLEAGIAKLEDEKKKLLGKSQQAAGAPASGEQKKSDEEHQSTVMGMEMSKEDLDLFAVGQTMGAAVNKETGIK